MVARHTPAPETALNECARCGLQYFAPAVPGDASFYRELMSSAVYERERWEFGVVAGTIPRDAAVLDIGCGDGAFLRRVRGAARVVGVDHNEPAIERLRAEGFEAHAEDAAIFAEREASRFDVVVAFHTVEHLVDVSAVIEPAARCLKPDGRIFVSVPNRRRYGRPELEPLDCPPHHLSRWSAEQFESLAERFDLTRVETRFEEPDRSHAYLRQVERARSLGRKLAGTAGGEAFARAYTRVGLSRATLAPKRYAAAAARRSYTRRGVYGMTMLAEFRLRS